jgi:hypothetical protein
MQKEQLQPPPKDTERREQGMSAIERYLLNHNWNHLLKRFGYQPPQTQNLGEIIIAQKIFTNETFDFRQQRERHETPDVSFSDNKHDLVIDTATALGMVEGSMPKKRDKHRVIVLGAGGPHAFYRSLQAKKSGVHADIAVLSGNITYTTKPLTDLRQREDDNNTQRDSRREAYDQYLLTLEPRGTKKIPETTFMTAGVESVWGGKQANGTYKIQEGYTIHEITHKGEDVKLYHSNNEQPDIIILQAESKKPEKRTRTNTADTYESLRDFLPPTATKLLIVTTGIFVPFQHLDAIRTFSGREVETIGFDTRRTSFHTPSRYLQEMNTMVNSAHKLYHEINT